jgi:hypothetical protein
MRAAGAGETCHALFVRTEFHAEKVGDELIRFLRVYGALPGLDFAIYQLFGECPAAGGAAGPAIRSGQEFLDVVDARVFPDKEPPVGHYQDRGEQQAEPRHERDCDADGFDGEHEIYS